MGECPTVVVSLEGTAGGRLPREIGFGETAGRFRSCCLGGASLRGLQAGFECAYLEDASHAVLQDVLSAGVAADRTQASGPAHVDSWDAGYWASRWSAAVVRECALVMVYGYAGSAVQYSRPRCSRCFVILQALVCVPGDCRQAVKRRKELGRAGRRG